MEDAGLPPAPPHSTEDCTSDWADTAFKLITRIYRRSMGVEGYCLCSPRRHHKPVRSIAAAFLWNSTSTTTRYDTTRRPDYRCYTFGRPTSAERQTQPAKPHSVSLSILLMLNSKGLLVTKSSLACVFRSTEDSQLLYHSTNLSTTQPVPHHDTNYSRTCTYFRTGDYSIVSIPKHAERVAPPSTKH